MKIIRIPNLQASTSERTPPPPRPPPPRSRGGPGEGAKGPPVPNGVPPALQPRSNGAPAALVPSSQSGGPGEGAKGSPVANGVPPSLLSVPNGAPAAPIPSPRKVRVCAYVKFTFSNIILSHLMIQWYFSFAASILDDHRSSLIWDQDATVFDTTDTRLALQMTLVLGLKPEIFLVHLWYYHCWTT